MITITIFHTYYKFSFATFLTEKQPVIFQSNVYLNSLVFIVD